MKKCITKLAQVFPKTFSDLFNTDMSYVMTCADMLQGMIHPALYLMPVELSYILSGKFCSGLVKDKINFYFFQVLQLSKNLML
jgi:hypothetical protein